MRYEFYRISLINNPEYTYIGYTTNFTKRKYKHKQNLKDKTKINMPLYKTINEYGGWDNVYMSLLEYGEYDNLKDVYIRERELIDIHKSLLNGHLPSKIDINYSDNPKEYKSKWFQDYKNNNPDEYKEKIKEKNETYREYKAKWHQENKERINNKMKELVRCEICNTEITKYSLWNHNRSKSHLKKIESSIP